MAELWSYSSSAPKSVLSTTPHNALEPLVPLTSVMDRDFQTCLFLLGPQMPLDYRFCWSYIPTELIQPLALLFVPHLTPSSSPKAGFQDLKNSKKSELWLCRKERKINLADLGYDYKTNFHNSPGSKWQVPFSPMAECHILTMASTWAVCWEGGAGDASWKILLKEAMRFPTCQFVKKGEKMSHRENEMTFGKLKQW